MRATGAVIDRLGARTTAVTVAALGVAAFLPGLAGSPAQLALALLVLGAASGAMDVAINAEGVLEEEASGRPVLNLAHASFSASVVAASLLAGALRALGAGAEPVLALAGAEHGHNDRLSGLPRRPGRGRRSGERDRPGDEPDRGGGACRRAGGDRGGGAATRRSAALSGAR
jgi:hypothetical protein